MSEHKYRSEGSDYKHGALRMIAMCSCGWSGSVIERQSRESHQEAKRQWEGHIYDVDQRATAQSIQTDNEDGRYK